MKSMLEASVQLVGLRSMPEESFRIRHGPFSWNRPSNDRDERLIRANLGRKRDKPIMELLPGPPLIQTVAHVSPHSRATPG